MVVFAVEVKDNKYEQKKEQILNQSISFLDELPLRKISTFLLGKNTDLYIEYKDQEKALKSINELYPDFISKISNYSKLTGLNSVNWKSFRKAFYAWTSSSKNGWETNDKKSYYAIVRR